MNVTGTLSVLKCVFAGAQVKPEARTYYELSAATLKFVFPRPGFLEGIKGRSQAITKITNVRSPPSASGDPTTSAGKLHKTRHVSAAANISSFSCPCWFYPRNIAPLRSL